MNPTKPYPGRLTPTQSRAMRILEIAFSEFFNDTRQLVADGIRQDIDHRNADHPSGHDSSGVHHRSKDRENNLKCWLKLDNPLSYGHKDKNKTFETLLQAVVAEKEDIVHGLPHMMHHAMTPSALVSSLIAMSRPLFPAAPSAPVLSNGSFLPTLKLAHSKLIQLANTDNPDTFVSSMFLYAIKHFNISFIPFHLPRTGSRGAPNKKPVFNSWAYLGLQDLDIPNPLPPPSNAPSFTQSAASIALTKILAHDSNAAWSIRPLHLKDISSIVHKTTLPTDYTTPSPSNASYVNETFHWVKQAYDHRKPLHHLALLVSLIVTCLRPNLFLPTDVSIRALFASAHTKDEVREIYNSLPWVNKKKDKKGLSDETILVSMFTTFIIALYEPTSPLRVHMQSSSRGGLGDAWTTKYSMFSSIFPSFFIFHLSYLFHLPSFQIAVKSISYPTLIRIGILWGIGPGAYEKGKFGETWGCHSPQYIRNMHDTLIQKLTGSDDDTKSIFAPFDTLSLLIGDKNARIFCQESIGISARPPLNATSLPGSNQMTSKHINLDYDSIDIDMDDDI